MAKSVKVSADLRIQGANGEIKVTNEADGSLVIDFPNPRSFHSFADIPLPFKPGIRTIGKANAALWEQRQVVVVKVAQVDWLVLGRNPKAFVKYVKFIPIYLKQKLSRNVMEYLAGGLMGLVFTYLIVKKRN